MRGALGFSVNSRSENITISHLKSVLHLSLGHLHTQTEFLYTLVSC